ncbi:MAG: amino acid ABC transporter ATP-binding protein, partial [Bacteroidota bacterium]
MDKNKSIVKIEGLFKAFNNVPVLRGLGLEVSEGSFISIIGPSGCGKTTLLRCLNGLEHPDAGMIEIAGSKLDISGIKESCENLKKGYYPGSVNATDPDSLNPRKNGRRLIREKLHEFRDKTGLLFQGFNLFPHLNVLDNVALAPRIVNNQSREKSEELAKNLLDKVGLKDYIKRWPSQLSGGQLQRVAIARALAMNPGVMLYDEPTSALDPSLVNEIYVAMMKLKDE